MSMNEVSNSVLYGSSKPTPRSANPIMPTTVSTTNTARLCSWATAASRAMLACSPP